MERSYTRFLAFSRIRKLVDWRRDKAFWLLSPDSFLRSTCQRIVDHWTFDYIVLCVIMMSSVIMVIEPNPKPGDVYGVIESALSVAYIVEMLVRMTAHCVYFSDNSYFSDGWNVIDFVISMLGAYYLTTPDTNGLVVVRLVRILRPLRSLAFLPGAELMLTSFLRSVPALRDLCLLLFFTTSIFAIVGNHLYMGKFSQRCFDEATGVLTEPFNRLCSVNSAYGRQCPSGQFCADSYENPNDGVTSFDNIFMAWLAVLQCISLEGWARVMYWLQDIAYAGHVFYPILLVVLGNFFMLNLASSLIAVVFGQSKRAQRRETLEKNTEELRLKNSNFSWGGHWHDSNLDLANIRDAMIEVDNSQVKDGGNNSDEETASSLVRRSNAFLGRLAVNPWFESFNILVVLLNIVILSLDDYYASPSTKNVLSDLKFIFTVAYSIEAAVRIGGLSLSAYFSNPMDVYDFLIMASAWLQIFFDDDTTKYWKALAAFRFLRVLLLLRTWSRVGTMMAVIKKSASDIIPISVLLFFLMFIFAVMGGNFFSHQLDLPPLQRYSRANFDTFSESLLAVFQVVTGEQWNLILYDVVVAKGWAASLFVVALYIMGNVIGMSLMIAMLLSNFTDADTYDTDAVTTISGLPLFCYRAKVFFYYVFCCRKNFKEESEAKRRLKKQLAIRKEKEKAEREMHELRERMKRFNTYSSAPKRPMWEFSNDVSICENKSGVSIIPAPIRKADGKIEIQLFDETKTFSTVHTIGGAKLRIDEEQKNRHAPSFKSETATYIAQRLKKLTSTPLQQYRVPLSGTVCFFMHPNNSLRQSLGRFMESLLWKVSWTLFVFGSLLLLALDEPSLGKESTLKSFLNNMEYIVTLVYLGEFLLQLLVFGVYGHKYAYFNNPWKWAEFVTVLVGPVYILVNYFDLAGDDIFDIVKSLLALRCMRVIIMSSSFRDVTKSVLGVIPSFFGIFIFCCLFLFMFALIGLQLFQGRLRLCFIDGLENPTLDYDPCIAAGGAWENPDFVNFDNIADSTVTLFDLTRGDRWVEVMYRCVDSTDSMKKPGYETYNVAKGFFVAYVFIGATWMVGLIVGLIVHEFTARYAQETGKSLLPRDRIWLKIQQLVLSQTPGKEKLYVQRSGYRYDAYRLVENPNFELFILTVIVGNVFVLGFYYDGMSDAWERNLGLINVTISVLFISEAILLLMAYGAKQYFYDPWHKFDFLVVLIDIVSLVSANAEMLDVNIGIDVKILRMVRVVRFFRLANVSKSLRSLLITLYSSLPTLYRLGSVFVIVIYGFSVAAMNLFGKLAHGTYINEQTNFETLPVSMQTLFRMSTGEYWSGIMHDAQVQEPLCDASIYGDCGKTKTASIFFNAYLSVTGFLLLNVLVAVLLRNLENEADNSKNPINLRTLEKFGRKWGSFQQKVAFTHQLMKPCFKNGVLMMEASKILDIPNHDLYPLDRPFPALVPDNLIYYAQMQNLLQEIDRPLGLAKVPVPEHLNEEQIARWKKMDLELDSPNFSYISHLNELNIPLSSNNYNYIHYYEILLALCHHAYRVYHPNFFADALPVVLQNKMKLDAYNVYGELIPKGNGHRKGEETRFNAATKEAVVMIEKTWCNLQAKRRAKLTSERIRREEEDKRIKQELAADDSDEGMGQLHVDEHVDNTKRGTTMKRVKPRQENTSALAQAAKLRSMFQQKLLKYDQQQGNQQPSQRKVPKSVNTYASFESVDFNMYTNTSSSSSNNKNIGNSNNNSKYGANRKRQQKMNAPVSFRGTYDVARGDFLPNTGRKHSVDRKSTKSRNRSESRSGKMRSVRYDDESDSDRQTRREKEREKRKWKRRRDREFPDQ